MGILKKILSGIVEALDSLVGRGHGGDNENVIFGLLSLLAIACVFTGTRLILLKKFPKWKPRSSLFIAIGITLAFITIFCIVCLIIDH